MNNPYATPSVELAPDGEVDTNLARIQSFLNFRTCLGIYLLTQLFVWAAGLLGLSTLIEYALL